MKMPRRIVPNEERATLRMYLASITPTRMLSFEEQKTLFLRWREGDVSARDEFIANHLPLVVNIAFKIRHSYKRQVDGP